MNPFQRAREKAREARDKLCPGRAEEALTAKELLSAVETSFNLALLSVAPTYPELGGGSAVLKREQQTIYLSNEFSEWGPDYCGLVAHELGHLELDPAKSLQTIADIKTVLGGSGSPGVIKVEAYGARERQELQANVYARELLLPRKLAKAFVASGKGAYDVSKALGIPLEFARQQMLDGLLLPEKEEEDASLKPASKDQWKAATADEQFSNVIAGPGTGKTSTLIHRVKYLIEKKGVDPRELLVLTFTNRAALELVERLRIAGIENSADIWAGTFHAFGLEFLRKYHQRFGLEADLNVADQMYSISALVASLPQLKLKYYLRVQDPYDWLGPVVVAINRLKEELVTPDKYQAFIKAHKSSDEEVQRRREDVLTLYVAHEKALAKKQVAGFVDLIAKPALAIAEDRVPFSEFIDRFKHVLVDEYQDVTRCMVEFLRQLAYKKSLWVVGDVRQAIHHWRGASLQSLLKFDHEFKAHAAGKKIGRYPLEQNRRSNSEILDLVQEIGRQHALQAKLPLDPMTSSKGKSGKKPILMTCDKRADVPLAIEQGIAQSIKEGFRYGDQAVLCRYTSEVHKAADHLLGKGLPVLYVGDLARRPEVNVLLCLMQLVVERQPRSLVGLTRVPTLSMPLEDIQVLLDATKGDQTLQRGRWIYTSSPKLSKAGEAVRKRLKVLVAEATHSSNPWNFVCDLLLEHRVCIPDSTDNSIPSWVIRLALWQFAYSVRNGDGDMREARLVRYLLRQRLRQRVGDTYVDRGLPSEASALDGVRIETVHGSKGLEFGVVHAGWISAEHYGAQRPSWKSPEDLREIIPPEVFGGTLAEHEYEQSVERNNLLYVAASRAMQRLYLYEEDEFQGNDLAPQLANCDQLVERSRFSDQKQDITKASSPKAFTAPATLPLRRMDAYTICPLQYWYSDVLELDRNQDVDVAVRAQWAIMEALRKSAAGEGSQVSALTSEWSKAKLPSSAEDPALVADAKFAYDRGLALIKNLMSEGGVFAEPVAGIANLRVRMSWGILSKDAYKTTFHLIRFDKRRARDIGTLLRPLVQGMEIPGTKVIDIRFVLSDGIEAVRAAGAIVQTKGFKAAVNLTAGRVHPEKGHHCSHCPYTTLCPQAPSL